MRLTNEQFDVLVKLMRGTPDSPANRSARRVLVDGITQADAMREEGVKRATVNGAVRRYAAADAAVRLAYLKKKPAGGAGQPKQS